MQVATVERRWYDKGGPVIVFFREADMPLLDHFHPPLRDRRDWGPFHGKWANTISDQLNAHLLPSAYVAEPYLKWGRMFEIDVGTVDEEPHVQAVPSDEGGVATAVWAPPRPTISTAIDFADLDAIEVKVYHLSGGRKLVSVVELISPANKDRPAHRKAFVTKCAAYLQQGISVIVIDVVTERTQNLHAELLDLLDLNSETAGTDFDLYAVAYRTVGRGDNWKLEAWPEPLALAKGLPTLPLWLDDELSLPLDLEQTYSDACRLLRIKL